jgi:polysaccharide export outer membrane protein
MRTPILVRALVVLSGLASAVPSLVAGQAVSGPIQPGDRVLLRVTGEPTLSDTFTVTQGPALDLPALGTVPLAGVARDSIQRHLTAFLSRYLNTPIVRAEVLLRLGIIGEVTRPGFYALPAGAVLEDLIMTAGGMTRDARFERSRLERNEAVLLRGEEVERAVASGRTLDALGLRSGDALPIPRRPDPERRVRSITAVIALPVAIYGLTRLF